jgi:hypothetical protein
MRKTYREKYRINRLMQYRIFFRTIDRSFHSKKINYAAKDDKKKEKRIKGFVKIKCLELLESNILLNLPK